MHSTSKTVAAYIKSLPADRAVAIKKIRAVIKKNLPKGIEEAMNWGMITYQVPLKTYPDTYNKQPLMFAALSSQKNHMAVYLTNIYSSKKLTKWFISEYKKSGNKLNMGRSCVRFTKLENLPLDLIGKTIQKTTMKQFIDMYERTSKKK